MGGETSPRDDSSEAQLHSAFKKLKVDPDWNPSEIKGNVENLRDLWIRDASQASTSSCSSHKGEKCCRKKLASTSARIEPYPQDFLCSMAEKLTFHSEICRKQSCMCSDIRLKSKAHFNYASSSVHHRSLIREAKLKFHHSEKDTKQVLRAARLKIFKHGKQLDSKSSFRQTFGCPALLNSRVLSSAPKLLLFGARSKQEMQNFQSLIVSTSTFSSKSKAFKFDVHRSQCGGSTKRSREQACSLENANRNSYSDCGKELRCSQQAKLEDISVDELAGYFEDFVHIPKKMSSMAEMMYT